MRQAVHCCAAGLITCIAVATVVGIALPTTVVVESPDHVALGGNGGLEGLLLLTFTPMTVGFLAGTAWARLVQGRHLGRRQVNRAVVRWRTELQYGPMLVAVLSSVVPREVVPSAVTMADGVTVSLRDAPPHDAAIMIVTVVIATAAFVLTWWVISGLLRDRDPDRPLVWTEPPSAARA